MLRTIQCQYETVHFAPSVLKGGSRLLSQNLAKLLATDASVQMRSVSLFVEIGSPVIIGECVPTEHACTGSFDGGRIQNPSLCVRKPQREGAAAACRAAQAPPGRTLKTDEPLAERS